MQGGGFYNSQDAVVHRLRAPAAIAVAGGDVQGAVRARNDVPEPAENPACLCGEVLKGKLTPFHCPLFATLCTPESPVGACMVSSEGTCAAAYKYGR